MNLGHYVTQIPPDITPTGLFYVYVAYLLNNHHQDGKGQGAIERAQDVAAIRRAAAVTAGGGIFIETIPKKVGPGLYNLPIL